MIAKHGDVTRMVNQEQWRIYLEDIPFDKKGGKLRCFLFSELEDKHKLEQSNTPLETEVLVFNLYDMVKGLTHEL